MVKRLRRSPLTAESGVRFPLGSPKKKNNSTLRIIFFFVFLFFLSSLFTLTYRIIFLTKKEEIKKKNCGLCYEKIKGIERAKARSQWLNEAPSPGVISKKTALLLVFEINSKSIALTLVFSFMRPNEIAFRIRSIDDLSQLSCEVRRCEIG